MAEPALPPKAFISYSWSSEEHKQWVLDLATRLRNDGGINVVLDRWHLKEGHDKYHFMEQMVTDPEVKKVLIVCDRKYAEKADNRAGGVGTETQIISAEVYNRVDQEKFIPLIRERNDEGEPYHPAFLSTRMYIDFTRDDDFEDAYDRLVRNIHGRPELKAPEVGKPPAHIFVEEHSVVKTAGKFRRLKDAAERDKPNTDVMLADYLESLIEVLREFKIEGWQRGVDKEIDEIVLDRIEKMRPYRDEFIDFCILYSTYLRSESAYTHVHGFLEQLLALADQNERLLSDHYQFFKYEAFLYLISALVRAKQFKTAAKFADDKYLFRAGGYGSQMAQTDVHDFNGYVTSLDEYRNRRLDQRRVSITADLVKEIATHPKIGFRDLVQSDVILFLRPTILNREASNWGSWYPRLLVYGPEQGELELFARAATPSGITAIRDLFGANNAKEFASRLGAALSSEWVRRVVTSRDYFRLSLPDLVGFSRLQSL